MTTPEEITPETPETPETPAPEEVAEEVPPVPETPGDDVPAWGQELQATVTELRDLITGANAPEEKPPGDGEEIPPDDSPVKMPWTHRGFSFFGGKS